MRTWLALWRKEMAAQFRSPMAYAILTVFSAVSGLNFWRLAVQSQEAPLALPLMIFGPVFFWAMVLMAVTVITMRLFPEEKRLGTLETLVTAPVRERQVVLAKYAAALACFVFVCTPSVGLVFVLRHLSSGIAAVDWGPVGGGYLILILCGAFYTSVGLFVSALARSQVVAAVVTFAILCVIFFVEYLGYLLPPGAGHAALIYLSATRHIVSFSMGLVDTRPIVFYLSGTVFMLFVTIRVIEAERWR